MKPRLLSLRTTAAIMSAIVVSPASDTPRVRKEHWANDGATKFKNPWPSAQAPPTWELIKAITKINRMQNDEGQKYDVANIATVVPSVKPTWRNVADAGRMKVTWLGHAACLVEMPSSTSIRADEVKGDRRGVRVLFDPAFSERCAPFQSFGLAPRVAPPICPVQDLPEIDLVVISHNHYDHQDNNTLSELYKKQADRPPALFIPLNNIRGLPYEFRDSVTELDWWEDRIVEVEGVGKLRITCTPSQHISARTPFDRNVSLWSSWALQHIPDDPQAEAPSLWFGGDTGYCSRSEPDAIHHPPGPDVATCPAFAEIGKRLGPFSLGLIPIGAYIPKATLTCMHCDPYEAIRIFQETQCKKALGIHWGVWRMAEDRVAEPPKLLDEARRAMGIAEEEFGISKLGETIAYDP